ncbi:hypothetical protein [Nocardioides halotolerans]|jgi:hypothetical protein|uniref:hypothetical protein n=1 Tax=Nocardioides halotolerans TaxID=433660 RepID=UPI0003F87E10|nr:hypothetical protein [Nocardioides halotolerans]
MKPRSAFATLTALAAATASLLAAAPAEAAGPAAARTTITLLHSGKFRVVSAGEAPRGAAVYLQDRFNRHQVWSTVKVGRASKRGTFRLVTTTRRSGGSYRTCVARPGRDACTRGARPAVVKRTGKVTLLTTPSVLTPLGQQVVGGEVTGWLRDQPLHLQYRHPATHKWTSVDEQSVVLQRLAGPSGFTSQPFSGIGVGALGLRLRVTTEGDRFHAEGRSAPFTADSYRDIPLSELPVVSGSLDHKDNVVVEPSFYVSTYSQGTAPSGSGPTNTAVLSLGEHCSAVVGGVTNDHGIFQYPTADFTASVALDGVTVFSHASMSDPFEFNLPVTTQHQLSLTASYDPATHWLRPWFVRNLSPNGIPAADHASAVCAH